MANLTGSRTDHLGDLLGNVTKAAVRVGAQDLTIQIVVL
jgi:hypothetical protein